MTPGEGPLHARAQSLEDLEEHLRIYQPVELRGDGWSDGDVHTVGRGRTADGTPIVVVGADAAGQVVGLDEQAPADVIGWPGQGQRAIRGSGDNVGWIRCHRRGDLQVAGAGQVR